MSSVIDHRLVTGLSDPSRAASLATHHAEAGAGDSVGEPIVSGSAWLGASRALLPDAFAVIALALCAFGWIALAGR